MKKAKIMLSAIMVLAVVGGALAFTAKNIQTTLYTVHLPLDPTHCTIAHSYMTTTGGLGTRTISATTSNFGVCTTFTLTDVDN